MSSFARLGAAMRSRSSALVAVGAVVAAAFAWIVLGPGPTRFRRRHDCDARRLSRRRPDRRAGGAADAEPC